MKTFLKNKIIILAIILFSSLIFVNCVKAATVKSDAASDIRKNAASFQDEAGFTTVEPGNIIATVIKSALSLLGIIFLVILVIAGYKYMTAAGNEDKVHEAIDSIKRAIIGIIIVLSAYSITTFVFSRLDSGTSGSSSESSGGVTTGF